MTMLAMPKIWINYCIRNSKIANNSVFIEKNCMHLSLSESKIFISKVSWFQIRDYLDALDGNVAREISSSHALGMTRPLL